MDEATQAEIARLAQEGKPISKIVEEDFPDVEYWDAYAAVRGLDQRSSQGLMKMISSRLKKLERAKGNRKAELIDELRDITRHLYRNHKVNARKLDGIRKSLDR